MGVLLPDQALETEKGRRGLRDHSLAASVCVRLFLSLILRCLCAICRLRTMLGGPSSTNKLETCLPRRTCITVLISACG